MQILRALLFPFSIIYDLVTRLRNFLYNKGYLESRSYPMPIICVGNLSVGGTGKSPMIAYLVGLLLKENDVAVLSRGYGRKTKGFVEVTVNSTSQEVGDEPLQLKKNFPNIKVVVCEDRRAALEKMKHKVDVVLMDDGFQHRKVKPTFNIILSAYDSLYCNDFLLPTGNLRESRVGVKRADVIVVTKCPVRMSNEAMQKVKERLKIEENQKVFFSTIDYDSNIISVSQTLPIDYLLHKNFTLVTGIAKSKPLVQFLNDKGFNFTHKNFPDHHEFSTAEVSEFKKEALILTTEKDFVRLQLRLNDVYYLPIKTKLLNDETIVLNKMIENVIASFNTDG